MNEIPVIVVLNNKKTYKKINNELRDMIIKQMGRGLSAPEVADMYDQNTATVRKIYCNYQKNGVKTLQPKGRPKQKLSEEQKQTIIEWVDNDCVLTIDKIRQKCLENWPELESISWSTVNNVLKRFHYSFKRISLVPMARNTSDAIQKRYEYAIQYNQLMVDKEKLFFIDKMGVQIWSRRSGGRAPIGKRASKVVKQIRSRNYSICAAMRSDSLYFFEIQDRPYNKEYFNDFLEQLFLHLVDEGITGAHIIMDNVPFHKTLEIRNLIAERGHNAVYLPPYSPFLNPIENLFNQWKSYVRNKQSENEDQLYDAVHSSAQDITQENCLNYVRNMEQYMHRCLNKEVILN